MSERDRKALEYPFDKYPDKDSSWRSVQDAVVKLQSQLTVLREDNNEWEETTHELNSRLTSIREESTTLRKEKESLDKRLQNAIRVNTELGQREYIANLILKHLWYEPSRQQWSLTAMYVESISNPNDREAVKALLQDVPKALEVYNAL